MRIIVDVFSTLVILGSVVLLVVWFASDLDREYSGSVIVIDGDTVIINGIKSGWKVLTRRKFTRYAKKMALAINVV